MLLQIKMKKTKMVRDAHPLANLWNNNLFSGDHNILNATIEQFGTSTDENLLFISQMGLTTLTDLIW